MVVNLDPESTSLELVSTLYQMLQTRYKVLAKSHVHSSATDVTEKYRNIFIEADNYGNREEYQVALTVVWKKGKQAFGHIWSS